MNRDLDLAYRGFEAACQRALAGSNNTTSPDDVFASVAEALWWAVSVDEAFRKSEPRYVSARRGSSAVDALLNGIRYARNRSGHQLAIVHKAKFYRTYVQTKDGRWVRKYREVDGRWVRTYEHVHVWRRLSDLPTPDPRFADPGGAADYTAGMEGRPIVETLRDVDAWFRYARQLWP